MRSIGSPAALEWRRQLAVVRVSEGYSTEEVADFLGVDPRSVRRWLAAFRQHGDAGLAANPVPGRPAKLSASQEKIIRRWLNDCPTEHGFPTELWTAARLAQLIEQEWDIHLHPGYLAAAAGVHPPEAAAGEPRAQRRSGRPLARPGLAAHQKKARRCGACLLWMDESGLLMAPLVRRSWAVRGQPPEQEQKAGHREKVAVAAALWLPPARDRLHLAYRTLVNGYFTNLEVAEFLLCAVEGLPDPVIAMWDCGNMHKGPPIRELVDQAQGRLAIESVPPYSPELMPVEFLWSWLKYGRLCNFAPRDAARLNEVIAGELDPIQEDQELLQSFFHRSALRLPRTLLS